MPDNNFVSFFPHLPVSGVLKSMLSRSTFDLKMYVLYHISVPLFHYFIS